MAGTLFTSTPDNLEALTTEKRYPNYGFFHSGALLQANVQKSVYNFHVQ